MMSTSLNVELMEMKHECMHRQADTLGLFLVSIEKGYFRELLAVAH
jgi:hypothetical protein